MHDSPPAGLIAEAIKLGLLAPAATLQPHRAANADRRNPVGLTWLTQTPAGHTVLLSTGPQVRSRALVQATFALACPELVRPPLASLSTAAGDLLVEEFFSAPTLAALAAHDTATRQRILSGFTAACRALAATEAASTEAARQAEWTEWSDTLTRLPCWQPAEAGLLRSHVLPQLYPRLARGRPVTRWSNGDFTAGNLLIDAPGRPRLIDLEHARETHFFTEDASRFHALSALARDQPALFTPVLPRPGPAWQLFFWLRQLGLEATHNTESYLASVLPRRLAVIRRLAEQVLGLELAGWSVESQPLQFTLETARWPGDGSPRLQLAGWVHAPGSPTAGAVLLHDGEDRELASAPLRERPDVEGHFAGAPDSRRSGFELEPVLPAPDLGLQLSLLDGEGTMLPFQNLRTGDLPGAGPFLAQYPAWACRHDPDPAAPAASPAGPRFSILLPVYRSDPGFLRACVASVRSQHYPHWELLLADDGSGSPALTALLAEFAGADARIRVTSRPENRGIARTTNEALALATGDYVVFVDHDDLLRPHALTELAAAIHGDPAADGLYSDEEKISAAGERQLPFLKPAYSPEFLRGVMYPGHVLCVRRALAQSAGGLDPAYDGVQDFEFFLRLTEAGARITHLPRILYQWRQAPTSSALHGNIKGDMDRKQAAAVQAHLQRLGDTRQAVALGGHRLRLQATASPRWEVVTCAEPDQAVAALRAAAAASPAEILVLLPRPARSDDEPWLREVAALAARPDSAFVGPLLLNPAGRVAASGLTAVGGKLVPVMAGFDAAGDGYNGSLRCNREVLAVPPTGAAIRRELLLSLPDGPPHDWAGISRALTPPGRFNRVCAAARLQLPGPVADLPAGASHLPSDPFYNPHFAPPPASYQLARFPAHLPPPAPAVLFHFDAVPAAFLDDGCATLRGWCFRRDGLPATLRVRSGHQAWSAACVLPRPDVALAHPAGLTDGHCGFSLRFVLPAGSHELIVESLSGTSAPVPLATLRTVVPPFPSLRRLLAPHPPSLLAHQFPAWPAHAPRWLRPERFPATGGTGPALAIVTPSYQQASYLDETMRSVLQDAPSGLAYVVQDGGSTDDSTAIIQRHAARLHAWESTPDRGQADAIARGFAKTAGGPDDLMAWINSDDFYLPGALRYVADYFARHPDVDVVYGHRVLVDDNSQEIGRWFLPGHDPEVLRLNDFVPQETLFWRRRLWDKVGGLDTSFRFALDWDLLLRFQAAGAKIVRVPYFLACFRIHAAQKTSAQMHSIGQAEIDRLRERTFGRPVPPSELESHPRLLRYLRRSAFIEFLWKLGLRAP